MDLTVRRYGNLIDFSPDGQSPLPEGLVQLLAAPLTYTYRESLRGQYVVNPETGKRQMIRFQTKRLYKLEEGRLVTSFGMLTRLRGVLDKAGHRLFLRDLTPPSPRPDAYEPCWANVEQWIRFRHPRQREMLEAMINNPCGTIEAAPGVGKSYLVAAFGLLFPKAKIDIVVRRIPLVYSTVRTMRRYLPSVGMVGDGHKELGQRITVYCVASVHHAEGDADFLIGDEAHELLGDNYATSLASRYATSRNFGITATPTGRFDGGDARMEALFGPLIFRMTYQEAQALGLVAPVRIHWVPVVMDINPAAGKEGQPMERWGLWRNDYRNQMVAQTARWFGPDEQVLIMTGKSGGIEHAVNLHRFLPEFALCYGEHNQDRFDRYKRTGQLPADFPDMTTERREMLRSQFEAGTLKKVIATDVWSTGVDFARLAVMIRADGLVSSIQDLQLPGRATRIHQDKSHALIVDFIDYFDERLRARSRKRQTNYAAKGWLSNWPERNRRLEAAEAPDRSEWRPTEVMPP